MAESYTPTTADVRDSWVDEMFPIASAEALDRWLAEDRRTTAEKAWDEGASALAALQKAGPGYEVGNPYRKTNQ